MTATLPFTTKVGREDALRLLRTPGAYTVAEMSMTYFNWIRRPGKPDIKVSKAVIGWIRDHHPGWYDESTKPWKWYLAASLLGRERAIAPEAAP